MGNDRPAELMLYESQRGAIRMALAGELIVTRALRPFREPEYLRLVELVRGADVAFGNSECLFHDYEGPPAPDNSGTYMRADPRLIEDLKWMGFGMVACAQNHAYDYGDAGVLANIRHLDEYGLAHAGTGATLSLAQSPAYLDTPKGRVALVAATDHLNGGTYGRAVDPRGDVPGKPGIHHIRVQASYTVDGEAMAALRRISQHLGWDQRNLDLEGVMAWLQGRARVAIGDPEGPPFELGLRGEYGGMAPLHFRAGNHFETHYTLNEEDVAATLGWIEDARRMADWVIFSIHHFSPGYPTGLQGSPYDEPGENIVRLAHHAIDAGADAVVGHGPHRDQAIELYRGKPIFYSLGDFILQSDTVLRQPASAYTRRRLPPNAPLSAFYEDRSGGQSQGQAILRDQWQSTLAVVDWDDRRLAEIRLYPVDLGMGLPTGQRGRPVLAGETVGREVLDRLRRCSEPFGTFIHTEDGVGIIRPAGAVD
ncbi:MAG: CapA family protein [Chloroflexi bacterium]|nr:CapA family protein [Chloroflexota bacterium]